MDSDPEKTFFKDVEKLNAFTFIQKISFYFGSGLLIVMLYGISQILGTGQMNAQFWLGLIIGIVFYVIVLWSKAQMRERGKSILKYMQGLEAPLDILDLSPKMQMRPSLINYHLTTLMWRTKQKIPWIKSIEHQFVDGEWKVTKCLWRKS